MIDCGSKKKKLPYLVVEMEIQQQKEWVEAQKISVSVDLVETAKKQLQFLAAVDRNRFLYEDHVLKRSIYRYNNFWLPLLAKHEENPISEDPLVVPLDCEWIWHCHRLNPVRYKFDCEKLYGRILGNSRVISSVQSSIKKNTEAIWQKLYPEEPYELDLNRPFSKVVSQTTSQNPKVTNYDLLSAVKRQMSFTFQVSRPYMSDDLFLQEAMARYKGFLHLIRTNKKMNLKRACVPTFDIDLMWHTHQLCPDSYGKDMIKLVGFVIQHDDSDSDRSKGSKLDIAHSETTRQWEQTFGSTYWIAGAVHKGTMPTPVTLIPYEFNVEGKDEFNTSEKCGNHLQFPSVQAMEVLLEFADIKNLPDEYKENIQVVFSKIQPDKLFKAKSSLGISSYSEERQFALFQCEPMGELVFDIMSYLPSNEPAQKSLQPIGSCSLSLKELMASSSHKLSTNKWILVHSVSGLEYLEEPILLHVSVSFTPPSRAPQIFRLVCSKPSKDTELHADVMDIDGKKLFSLGASDLIKATKTSNIPVGKEVFFITDSGEKHALGEFHGSYWCIKGTQGSFKLQNNSAKDDSLFELVGYKMVKLFSGRRLEFEPKQNKNEKLEQDFMTVVEFSTEYPYGKAVALINSKSKTIKATDEWIFLPGIALTFMLSDNLTTEGFAKENFISDEEQKMLMKNKGDGDNGGVTEKAKLGYGSQCIGQCTNCGDNGSSPCGDDWSSPCSSSKCVTCRGLCTKCDNDEALQDMMELGYGSQCIGQCTNCGDTWAVIDNMKKLEYEGWPCNTCAIPGDVIDVTKLAYGSQCCNQCVEEAVVEDMPKVGFTTIEDVAVVA